MNIFVIYIYIYFIKYDDVIYIYFINLQIMFSRNSYLVISRDIMHNRDICILVK